MMKRLVFLVALTVAALGTLYAQDNPIKFSAGLGVSFLGTTNDQRFTVEGTGVELKQGTGSFGINGFIDITQYFTVILGYRTALGQDSATLSFPGYSKTNTVSNNVSQFEIGAEVKYPFPLGSSGFSLAPKIGLDYIGFLSGGTNGLDFSSSGDSSDLEQTFSPLYLNLGIDLNYNFTSNWFVRVPLDLEIGLNARLSSTYYNAWAYDLTGGYSSSGSYTSSSNIGFRTGLEVGYTF